MIQNKVRRLGYRGAGPAPVISNVATHDVSDTTIGIRWTTDKGTIGRVKYGTTTALGSIVRETNHSLEHDVTLTGLTPGTLYHFRIFVRGRSGSASTADATFLSGPGGTTPIISNVSVHDITETGAQIEWNVTPAASGLVRYGTDSGDLSFVSNIEPALLTYHNQHLGPTATPPLPALAVGTTYYYRIESSADGRTGVYTGSFTTPAASQPGLPGVTTYGGGVNMAGLNNLRFGWSSSIRLVGMPFRARYSLAVTEIRWYKEVGSGYSSGNGGSGRLWQYPDSGGVPALSATPLASTDVVAFGTAKQIGRLDTFTTTTPLVAGNLYWIVWENTGAGTNDWVSIDCAHAWSGSDATHPHKRWPSATDYRPVWGSRSAFQTIDSAPARWTPTYELRYSNGEYQGHSYMEIGHQSDLNHVGVVRATGTRRIRQRFEHEGANVSVNGVGIAMQRSSASTADLAVTLKDSGGGALATATITGTGFPVGGTTAGDFRNPGGDYRRADLNTPVTLVAGNTYYLEFSTTGNGHFLCWGMRRGSNGFSYTGKGEWPTVNVGRAQISVNDGSSWYDLVHWGTRYDFNCYLDRAA